MHKIYVVQQAAAALCVTNAPGEQPRPQSDLIPMDFDF